MQLVLSRAASFHPHPPLFREQHFFDVEWLIIDTSPQFLLELTGQEKQVVCWLSLTAGTCFGSFQIDPVSHSLAGYRCKHRSRWVPVACKERVPLHAYRGWSTKREVVREKLTTRKNEWDNWCGRGKIKRSERVSDWKGEKSLRDSYVTVCNVKKEKEKNILKVKLNLPFLKLCV